MKLLLYILFFPIIIPVKIIGGILKVIGFCGFTKDMWDRMG